MKCFGKNLRNNFDLALKDKSELVCTSKLLKDVNNVKNVSRPLFTNGFSHKNGHKCVYSLKIYSSARVVQNFILGCI